MSVLYSQCDPLPVTDRNRLFNSHLSVCLTSMQMCTAGQWFDTVCHCIRVFVVKHMSAVPPNVSQCPSTVHHVTLDKLVYSNIIILF